jgi:hypothetical protein
MPTSRSHAAAAGSRWWNLLLLIPFIGLLWVPIYNRIEPKVFGIPFFYWYQFLWVLLTSLLIYAVHVLTDGVEEGWQPDEGERS